MPIQVLIVEDEPLSAQKLTQMLAHLLPDAIIVACHDTVRSTVKWLNDNPHPDLAFFDIQLADGISFEIFEQTEVRFPVIFTTAYNEYAIKAFKVNSIDYLLKPIKEAELSTAINKFRTGFYASAANSDYHAFAKALNQLSNNYKSRFLVKVGDHLKMISTSDTALFYSLEKAVFMLIIQGNEYALDFTLEQVASLIDPRQFFRVSRKHIVNIDYIKDVVIWSGSRLKIKLSVPHTEEIIVSREKVQQFKAWLDN
ncbi:LytR/AlgR family response regulator transcription factor [Alkaliflexus imshenetskii]|uniref:LytR/AlgR family response regulator transcription factor n=1 Tax=Alkaliflexus imshenetskii TaxID=286730 RepID=UPI000A069B4A|nr:LytTR family DNA-binding domain-containing protein [Alkaliflexus imshenetskii]